MDTEINIKLVTDLFDILLQHKDGNLTTGNAAMGISKLGLPKEVCTKVLKLLK